jgi:hypothetical protein
MDSVTEKNPCATRRVAVLDGGYPAWKAAGLPVDASPPAADASAGAAASAACGSPPAGGAAYRARLDRTKVGLLEFACFLCRIARFNQLII